MKKVIHVLVLNSSLLIFNCFAQQPGWDTLSVGVWGELNSIHFIDQYNLYMCGDLLLNFKSTDNGSTWQINFFSSPVTLNDIFVIDQYTVVAVGDGGTVMRTTDGGNTWNMFNSGVTDNLLSISFVDSFGICGALSQTILYSNDAGVNWNIAQSGFFGGGFWGAHMLSPQIGFIAGENSIFQPLLGITTDAGVNWNFIPFYLNNNEGRATGVDFTDINNGYVSASVWNGQGAIAKSTDGGNNWNSTLFSNPLWSVDFPISSASLIGYAVGSGGTILKTYNAGMNWVTQQSGTTLKLNKVHFIDLDFGFAVGENGIILRTTTGGEPVTKIDKFTLSVKDFRLEQNYPNPFNPSTFIKYRIPELSFVTLKVYDILGNEVATLVNKELSAGEYEIEFNAADLTSSVYIYQIKAAAFIVSKKMILLR